MARFKKYVYTTEEKYTADVVIYRYELDDLKDETLVWKLDDTNLSGEIALPTIPNGNVTKAGTISIPLDVKSLLSESDSRINDPVWRFELVLSSKNGSFKENRYPVWVVNDKFTVTVPEDLVITDDSVTALEALKNGKRVLFNGTKAPAGKNVVTSYWRPVYWSTYFFKGQKRTLGTWHDKSVFGQITPTQFADWFFYSLVERGRYVVLNGTPDFRPYGMPVCDFHSDYNDRLGSVFTASVGKGTLLYCGYDFDAQTPEAQALKNILLTNKAVWKPQVELSHEWFEKNLLPEPYIAPPRPAEYKDAEMFIYASVHVQDLNHHFDWIKSLDASELAPGYSYELHNCGSWKDDFGGFWIFNRNNATVTLKSQKQTKGKLIFVLCDSNSLGRTGKITCGWRTVEVPKHNINADRRTTVSIDLIREDWREGEITVKIEPIHGPNLQVEKMIYVPEE